MSAARHRVDFAHRLPQTRSECGWSSLRRTVSTVGHLKRNSGERVCAYEDLQEASTHCVPSEASASELGSTGDSTDMCFPHRSMKALLSRQPCLHRSVSDEVHERLPSDRPPSEVLCGPYFASTEFCSGGDCTDMLPDASSQPHQSLPRRGLGDDVVAHLMSRQLVAHLMSQQQPCLMRSCGHELATSKDKEHPTSGASSDVSFVSHSLSLAAASTRNCNDTCVPDGPSLKLAKLPLVSTPALKDLLEQHYIRNGGHVSGKKPTPRRRRRPSRVRNLDILDCREGLFDIRTVLNSLSGEAETELNYAARELALKKPNYPPPRYRRSKLSTPRVIESSQRTEIHAKNAKVDL